MKPKGIVYLVGAGPGDAGLLTVRGAELVGRADVVVYDALVNPELLALAPNTAEIIYGGKRAREHAIPQKDLNQLLIRNPDDADLRARRDAAQARLADRDRHDQGPELPVDVFAK